MRSAGGDRAVTRLRTAGTLLLLHAALPANLVLTAVAGARALLRPPTRAVAEHPRTIMISGGKMTKALQLARSFHAAGHRVVLVESPRYRLTGHRFSRAVDRFRTVPNPPSPDDIPQYVDALVDVVRSEGVDVYVPVCSPASSFWDARARAALEREGCEVLHGDPETIAAVDDKHRFAELATSLGLAVPETHRVTAPAEVEAFDFDARDHRFVLKSIPYDPVRRLDLTTLPRSTPGDTATLARSKPMSSQVPWILQEFVRGQEYCVHTTVRDGTMTLYCCCESSAFQVNYAPVDEPEIEAWAQRFVGALRLTGQYSFDLIMTEDGDVRSVRAIECNPRTHSAITLFRDHPGVADAYLRADGPVVRPDPATRPTYWIYHEVWRLLSDPRDARHRLAVIFAGRDAIFDWSDPLPFLLVHHLQIPSLLLRNLVRGRPWLRIDFNIGKLVEPDGD